MTDEVERGQLDESLFRIFLEARIWEERKERRRESIAVNRP
jgi:hypothetical protein